MTNKMSGLAQQWAAAAAVAALAGCAALAATSTTSGWGVRADARVRHAPAEQLADPIPAPPPRPDGDYFSELRSRMRWEPVRMGTAVLLAPDEGSRLLLARAAARAARLDEVGLGFADVYGLIHAETHWVPRPGASRDGTPNLGIAQFEPATAAALGVQDPDDVVEAVHAAARHMHEAALWSRQRVQRLKLARPQRDAVLREGVSVYYNLSSRARAAWIADGAQALPIETALHIRNTREGAREAVALATRLGPAELADPVAPQVAAAGAL